MSAEPLPVDTFLGDRDFPNARHVLAPWQLLAIVVLLAIPHLLYFVLGHSQTLIWLNGLCTVLFLASTLYRLWLIDVSLRSHRIFDTHDELRPPHGEWPRYVIQVPLYKEARALPHLVAALAALDYPQDRLTVQLLIEEDDTVTRDAAAALDLAPPFQVVLIPVSEPRTKPKACNVGLAQARGDYLVIYDAEDRPEPDQLKKAVIAFSQSPPEIACIQAKLNFYNSERNLITRCFTAEYAMWFDLCLPGLDQLQAPIPLGGTSNHFRLDVLRELQGWDEFNVTEDCDLGLRLFFRGYRTRMLQSTTWEEACPRFWPWIRQRSRWLKGYVQTYLVHTRDLTGLHRRLGLRNSLHFHLLIGGSAFFQLVAPLYWALVVVWILYRQEVIGDYFPGPIFVMGATCLFLGNFALVYSCAVACAFRGFGRVIKYTPLMVPYWIMMSLAAWKGVLQLVAQPHFWEKTQHHEG